VAADEEFLPFAAESFDLIVANLSLHGINDLPGALIQIRRSLVPDGLFLASLPALGTLAELRAALTAAEDALSGGASPRVAPFPDLRDGAALLQRAGFALPVADAEQIVLRYATPFALLRDLRHAGETNATTERSRITPPRNLFPQALADMQAEDGSITCTLRIAMLTGWAPGPGQPQALKPGSAQVSLIDALRGASEPPKAGP
jgi:SAM-dependent methyltransferase